MAKFTETTTTTYTVACPECAGDKVKKHGKQNGQERYFCKVCRKAFRAGGKAEGQKMDAEIVGSAIRDIYSGKSFKQTAEGLHDEYDLEKEPAKATIYEWTRDYTDKAIAEMKGHKAQTGREWVADDLMVYIRRKKHWLWNVMDSETRYILASHLSPRRDANAARVVLRKAVLAAEKPPETIMTDKLGSYISAVKEVLPETRHMQSEGMGADLNNNLSERLQGTFRDRLKTLRGMDSRETGQRYLDGWVLQYNLFRGHEALRNQTPGERAKVNPPFKEWADVVKAGAASRREVKAEARPASRSKSKLPQPEAAPAREAKVRKPLKEIGPEGERGQRARKRSGLKVPKPVLPRALGKARKPKIQALWERARPRLLRIPSRS